MKLVGTILLNRNTILVLAVIAGLFFGDYADLLKPYTVVALALTMTFSLTGLDFSVMNSVGKILKPFIAGIVLNYFLFGIVLLSLAWLLMPSDDLFYGFVVIVAAPPGVAIIPFSYILKGNVNYAIVGVSAAFLASIFLAPLLVDYFASSKGISPFDLFLTMLQLVVIPLIVAQILRIKFWFPLVQRVRGKVVDWGFALLIFVAVGLNRQVFFSDPKKLLLVSIVLALGLFGVGILYEFIAKKLKVEPSVRLTQNMLATIKSSGFSVFTALTLFGREAAIPSAVLAVMVLFYLIFLSIKTQRK
jgi:BASS family bile acid:Na+ symporter